MIISLRLCALAVNNKNMKLNNKVAIITGGARGIGKASAGLFAKEGATVIIWDLLDAGQETADEIVKAGGNCQFMKVAVTDPVAIEMAVSEIIKQHQKIDILINNAGILYQVVLLF